MVQYQKTQLNTSNYLTEGEPLVVTLKRLKEGKSGIEQITENTYSGAYQRSADIRTDKWNIALEALIAKDKKTAKDVAAQKEKAAEAEKAKLQQEALGGENGVEKT